MDEKTNTILERINSEIEKIDKKENNIYFFVIDTKGNPSGSLEYIYNLALILKDNGYKVTMLYQEDEFIGVGDWLGERYAELPHEDISKGEISVSPSDILFIPELFANIMTQTKNLPCKRIAILQNYDYVLEQIPMSVQWGDFGIMEAITNTDLNGELIKDIFPYMKTTTISPYINSMFGQTSEPKQMVVNIVCKDQTDINKIIKPFYWKYPMYKWVSFKDLRGFPKERFASLLREGAITIWVDDDTNFGYSAIEALQSGSLVIAKIPTTNLEWIESDEEDSVGLRNSCVWFENFHELPKIIASVVRGVITDKVPQELQTEAKKVCEKFSYDKTQSELLAYIANVFDSRKKEIESVKSQVKTNEENIENND